MPRQSVRDFACSDSERYQWDEVYEWIVEAKVNSLHESRPGSLGSKASIFMILNLCRAMLKECVAKDIASTHIQDVFSAKMIPQPKKCQKQQRAQETYPSVEILVEFGLLFHSRLF